MGLALLVVLVAQQDAPTFDPTSYWLNYGLLGVVLVAVLSGKALVPWWSYSAMVRENDSKEAEIRRLHDLRDQDNRHWGTLYIETAKAQSAAMVQSSQSLDAALAEIRRRA